MNWENFTLMLKLLPLVFLFQFFGTSVFGTSASTINETPKVNANEKQDHDGVRKSLPPLAVSFKDIYNPEPSTTFKPAHRAIRAYPETTYAPPANEYHGYSSPGYAYPPTVNPDSYGTTSTTTPSPATYSIQQVMHLLEMIRDSDAFDYLFPSHYLSRSAPNTCGCGEEIQQLQHAILLLQESVRQLRIFVHADEISKYSDNHKKVHHN